MNADTAEKLALMVAELMQELLRHKNELVRHQEGMAMLRREVLQLKDICRGCAGYQDDFK